LDITEKSRPQQGVEHCVVKEVDGVAHRPHRGEPAESEKAQKPIPTEDGEESQQQNEGLEIHRKVPLDHNKDERPRDEADEIPEPGAFSPAPFFKIRRQKKISEEHPRQEVAKLPDEAVIPDMRFPASVQRLTQELREKNADHENAPPDSRTGDEEKSAQEGREKVKLNLNLESPSDCQKWVQRSIKEEGVRVKKSR